MRLHIYETGVERVLEGALIAGEAWSRIDVRLEAGQVTLGVGNTRVSLPVTTVDTGGDELRVGDAY